MKIPLSFILGLVIGFLPTILITFGLYRFYRITGMPYAILGPQKFGNVRIMAIDNAEKTSELNDLMGVHGMLGLQSFGKTLVSLNFDKEKRLYEVSVLNDLEEIILSFLVSPPNGRMYHLSYGGLESELHWYDLDFDGVFDVQFRDHKKGKEIFVNNEWIRAVEKTGLKEATVIDGTTEIKYAFDFDEGKWLPVSDGELNEQ